MTLYMSALFFIAASAIIDLLFFRYALTQRITAKVSIAAICINTAGAALTMLNPLYFQKPLQLRWEYIGALLLLWVMKSLLYFPLLRRIDRRRFEWAIFLSTAIGGILWAIAYFK